MEESGLQLDDALLQPYTEGRVYLLAHNSTSTPQKLKTNMLLGHIEGYKLDQQIEGPATESLSESLSEGNGPVTRVVRGPGSEHLCQLLKAGPKDADDEKQARFEHQLKICEEGHTEEEITSLKECILQATDVFGIPLK